MNGLSVVVPVYNEEHEVGKVLQALKTAFTNVPFKFEIIVVNDGSTDTTMQILKQAAGITVIDNPVNKGYGASLKCGIERAKYDLVAITDADNTYPVEEITRFAGLMDDCDMVVGKRKKIVYPRFDWIKQRGRDAIDFLCSYLVGHWIPDINSGLRIFRKDIALKFKEELCDRFSFTTSLTLLAFFHNYKVSYFPINYYCIQTQRKTKVRMWKDGWMTLLLILSLGFKYAKTRILALLSALVIIIAGVLFFI
jgi:glycosyltransferase involved in cell wall biosynthesis